MNVNELMIGDWVLLGDRAVKILSINLYNGEDSMGGHYYAITNPQLAHTNSWVDMLEPIPLALIPQTDLEKDGWERKWLRDVYYRKEFDENRIFTLTEYEDPHLYGYYLLQGHALKGLTIRYVHELQHALRLCGIEEEVKL